MTWEMLSPALGLFVVAGVAIGSGWQALVAYVNIGSYYLVGVPIGIILGWPMGFGVRVRNIEKEEL
jgi:Na+-driven multidrug efflux pump